jgi:glutathione S-transferase
VKERKMSKAGGPRLHYFRLKGRGELIRLIYAYGKKPLEEVSVSGKEFAKIKYSYPFQQLPIFELNGKTYAQSLAIARYAASQVGLYPNNDPVEGLEIDMLVDGVMDIANPVLNVMFNEPNAEIKAQKVQRLNEVIFPRMLSGLNTRAEGPFFRGPKCSMADLALFDLAENSLALEAKLFPIEYSKYPKLLNIMKEVRKQPGITE